MIYYRDKLMRSNSTREVANASRRAVPLSLSPKCLLRCVLQLEGRQWEQDFPLSMCKGPRWNVLIANTHCDVQCSSLVPSSYVDTHCNNVHCRWKDDSGNKTSPFPSSATLDALSPEVQKVFLRKAIMHSDEYYQV